METKAIIPPNLRFLVCRKHAFENKVVVLLQMGFQAAANTLVGKYWELSNGFLTYILFFTPSIEFLLSCAIQNKRYLYVLLISEKHGNLNR